MKTTSARKLRILEVLHPVMLIMLAGPVLYTFFELRVDALVLPLCLSGLCLLPLSAAVRTAADRISSMWLFLLLSGAFLAATLYAVPPLAGRAFARALQGTAFSGPEPAAGSAAVPTALLQAEILLGGIWLIFSALRLRLRENRRARALLENDTSWQDRPLLAEKPAALCLLVYFFAYAAGLFTACPVLCDIALTAGTAYLLICLYDHAVRVTDAYLEETQRLANVPQNKLRGIRGRMLALLMVLVCVTFLPAWLSRSDRQYHDIRKWDWETEPVEMAQEVPPGPNGGAEDLEAMLGDHEPLWEPPAWLLALGKYLSIALMTAVLAGVALSIWREIMNVAGDFSDRPEENGDISRRLRSDEETAEQIPVAGLRLLLRGRPRTEKEQIRQTYRRTIRRYRKDLPARAETPSEIESAAALPQGFDMQGLHDQYEKARYGR